LAAETAKIEAQNAADNLGQVVTMRDPVTDKVQGTVKPRQSFRSDQ
jgi:hypothetical protein